MASIKTVLTYVVPIETPEVETLFRPFVDRFVKSLKDYDPGAEYVLDVILNGGDADAQARAKESFVGLPAAFYTYPEGGMDVGSFLFEAKIVPVPSFLVCCNTRVYAHRDVWLARLVEAREAYGPGLYATAVSREGGRLHACCRCFGIDSDILKQYPHEITSRDQGQFFESGDGCLLTWMQERETPYEKTPLLVHFDGVCLFDADPHAYCWTAPDIYRRGDQSNCLVHDRHTDYYRDASPEEKARLSAMCFGS